jgi:hypothetical protein
VAGNLIDMFAALTPADDLEWHPLGQRADDPRRRMTVAGIESQSIPRLAMGSRTPRREGVWTSAPTTLDCHSHRKRWEDEGQNRPRRASRSASPITLNSAPIWPSPISRSLP